MVPHYTEALDMITDTETSKASLHKVFTISSVHAQ